MRFGNQSETITLKTVSISIDVFLSQLSGTQSRHKSHGSYKLLTNNAYLLPIHNIEMNTATVVELPLHMLYGLSPIPLLYQKLKILMKTNIQFLGLTKM